MLLLAVENGYDPSPLLARVPDRVEPRIRPAPAGVTGAGLRRFMLQAATGLPVESLIFADFDDRLLPDALGQHAAALANADISYGDMDIIDETGQSPKRRFFVGADIPAALSSPEAVLYRNFLGFGNTAMRTSALKAEACAIPDAVTAADWWFFTMLLASGLQARRTEDSVAEYRVYRESVLGGAVTTSEGLRRRADIVRRHYAHLPANLCTAACAAVVERLIAQIEASSVDIEPLLGAAIRGSGVWFEDVARAAAAPVSLANQAKI